MATDNLPATEDPLMQMNLAGRLNNFSLSVDRALYPLFEAISNSIHAIEDSGRDDGQITVRIHRDLRQPGLTSELQPLQFVTGFTIEDNGVGFTDANFTSFRTADSVQKRHRGGKGVGRFSWLKAFEKAAVDSVFATDSGYRRRTFDFELTSKGIENHVLSDSASEECYTHVDLIGYRHEYKVNCPKNYDTIARKIIEHFLGYLVMGDCPLIRLIDSHGGTERSLQDIFQRDLVTDAKSESVNIDGTKLTIQHVCIKTWAREPNHHLHFCARRRSVEERDLTKLLSNLSGPLHDGNSVQFAYSAYISGNLFDSAVNQERTRLDIPHENTLIAESDPSQPTWEAILAGIAETAENFLEPYLAPVEERKLVRIAEFARRNPRFCSVVNLRPEWLRRLRADLSDEDLGTELYKLSQKLELENRVEGIRIRNEEESLVPEFSVETNKRKLARYLSETNQIGISKLAEYVVHRRAVLDFLSTCMKLDAAGKYKLEDVVHNVVFPTKTTSGTLRDPDQSNLWLLDERLSYHYYLQSDVRLSKSGEIHVDGESENDRPDLLVLQPYDYPHAFAGETNQPFDAVTIVEFKRPGREDYIFGDKHRDPIFQVWEYVRKIRSGKIKDRNGEIIQIRSGTQFYGYVVATLNDKLRQLASTYGFTPMPDNMGYFMWHTNLQIYAEVLDYKKVLQDAKKRNEVFFDKFDLPSPL